MNEIETLNTKTETLVLNIHADNQTKESFMSDVNMLMDYALHNGSDEISIAVLSRKGDKVNLIDGHFHADRSAFKTVEIVGETPEVSATIFRKLSNSIAVTAIEGTEGAEITIGEDYDKSVLVKNVDESSIA